MALITVTASLTIFLTVIPHPSALSVLLTAEANLTTLLLKDYNKNARPPPAPPQAGPPQAGPTEAEATKVTTALNLYQILKVDDRQQEITFTGGFLMTWQDDNLKWVPAMYGNTHLISLPADSIWRPDIGLSSGTEKAFDFSAILDTTAGVSYTGAVNWHVVRVFKSTCGLNMADFPFDVQNCLIKFSSQTQITQRLIQTPLRSNVLLNLYESSEEWDLVNATIEAGTIPIPPTLRFGSMITFNISSTEMHLRIVRRTGYYWINLIIPCMLISMLVMFVFAMPCDAGEKISFSVTILLAFTVYQLLVAGTLPKTSEDTPILSQYLAALIGLSTISVALSLLVLSIHHTDPRTKMSTWFEVLVFGCLALITFNRDKSRLLQRAKVCVRKEDQIPKDVNDVLKASMTDLGKENRDEASHSELVAIRNLLGTIGKLICAIYQDHLVSKDRTSEVNQWQLAATIIDRFFLMVYFVITVAVTLGLIVPGVVRQSYGYTME